MDHLLFESPIGQLELSATANGIASIAFGKAENGSAKQDRNGNPHLTLLEKELTKFFAGELENFTVPLDAAGTDFQKTVWSELSRIPYGQTTTYGEIAAKISKPKASRAVGGANNKNPLPIVVPCHRVVGANHSLVGYAGNLWRKQWLLEHEGAALPIG